MFRKVIYILCGSFLGGMFFALGQWYVARVAKANILREKNNAYKRAYLEEVKRNSRPRVIQEYTFNQYTPDVN